MPETTTIGEPNLSDATDLTYFGKTGVVLTPKKVTSVVQHYAPQTPMWGSELLVGCAGIELAIKFTNRDQHDKCFNWLKDCILANQR